jgi:Sulfotransferase domain
MPNRMLYGIRSVLSYVTGTDIAGRDFAVYPDDTLLVSYPRSGNTWTRFLIANLLFPNMEVDFTNIERLIPDTTLQSNRALKKVPRPRILKTHEYFDPRYPKTIYIVRDPRDVALSYCDYNRRNRFIDDSVTVDEFVDRFVAGGLGSAGWGTWAENVSSWVYARGTDPSFLLLRYMDVKSDPVKELHRVANFLNIEADAARIQTAVERSSAERMRQLEKLLV